jgi:hypothetical protein
MGKKGVILPIALLAKKWYISYMICNVKSVSWYRDEYKIIGGLK